MHSRFAYACGQWNVVVVLAALGFAIACGDAQSPAPEPAPEPTPAPEPAPAPEPEPQEITSVDASTIDVSETAELPTPSVDWRTDNQAPDAAGNYCCVCQKLSGQQRLQLTGVGTGFPVCVGCEVACRNDGHQGADGARSFGGGC